MITRRLAAAQALSLGALLVPSAYAAETCTDDAKVMTRENYDQYIKLYNACDRHFTNFYQEDVVMETVPPLQGRQAINDFRNELRHYVIEHITVEFFVPGSTGAAAQLLGSFSCVNDMPVTALSGLFGRAIKKGQVLKQRGAILYGVEDGRFKWIRAFPPIVVHDWA